MTDPTEAPQHTPAEIDAMIETDVQVALQRYFPADPRPDREPMQGYETVGFRAKGGLRGTDAETGDEVHVVRWRWRGYDGPAEGSDRTQRGGGRELTGNAVVVNGVSIVEQTDAGLFIHRFVDWLSVYAQLGMVTEGRPVGMGRVEVRDAPSPTRYVPPPEG